MAPGPYPELQLDKSHLSAIGLRTYPAAHRSSEGLSLPQILRLLSRTSIRIASEQRLSTALDFWFKAARGPIALATWIAFIAQQHKDHFVPRPDTRVLRKPQRNYGRLGRSVWERVDALFTRYHFAAAHLPPAMHEALLRDGRIHRARLTARDTHFEFWLGSSLPFGQKYEGETHDFYVRSHGRRLDPNGVCVWD